MHWAARPLFLLVPNPPVKSLGHRACQGFSPLIARKGVTQGGVLLSSIRRGNRNGSPGPARGKQRRSPVRSSQCLRAFSTRAPLPSLTSGFPWSPEPRANPRYRCSRNTATLTGVGGHTASHTARRERDRSGGVGPKRVARRRFQRGPVGDTTKPMAGSRPAPFPSLAPSCAAAGDTCPAGSCHHELGPWRLRLTSSLSSYRSQLHVTTLSSLSSVYFSSSFCPVYF